MIKIKNLALALTFLLSTTLQSLASYTPSHKNSPLERGGSEADGVCCTQQISPPLLHKNSPTLWVNILALEAHSEHYSSSNNSSFGLNFADGMKEAFKTTSASGGGDNYYGSGTSYTRPQFDVGGTFLAQGNNMNLEGMIHAKDMDIDLSGDLNITTVLDSYKGRGDGGNLSFSTDNVNFNINDKKDDKLWADANQVAGLYASNTADINVDGTTTLIGGAITADELNLKTADLVVKDLDIYDKSKDVSVGAGINLNNFDGNDKNDTNSYGNINYKDKGHTLEGEINSTIASNSGTITIGGKQVSDSELEARGVNTNLDKIHIITKDENWDRDLSVELANIGVTKEQFENSKNFAKAITTKVPDKVKAQGDNATDAYRRAIANGVQGAELEAYANSKNFQAVVTILNSYDHAVEKYGVDNIPEAYAKKILNDLNGLLFDKDVLYQQNCASGPITLDTCNKLMTKALDGQASFELIQSAIIDYMNGEYKGDVTVFETALPKYLTCLAALSVQGTKKGNITDKEIMKSLDKALRKKGYSFEDVAKKIGMKELLVAGFSFSEFSGKYHGTKEQAKDVASFIAVIAQVSYENTPVAMLLGSKGEKSAEIWSQAEEIVLSIYEDPSLVIAVAKELGYEAVTSNFDLAKYSGNQKAADFYDGYNDSYKAFGIITTLIGTKGADKVLKSLRSAKAAKRAAVDAIDVPNKNIIDRNGNPIDYKDVNGQLTEQAVNPEWVDMSSMLRNAANNKGNFGMGSGSRGQAQAMGEAWVGEGYKVASDGKTLISADGLRQYRPPSNKPNSPFAETGVQANFERREFPTGNWTHNGHLDIKD